MYICTQQVYHIRPTKMVAKLGAVSDNAQMESHKSKDTSETRISLQSGHYTWSQLCTQRGVQNYPQNEDT